MFASCTKEDIANETSVPSINVLYSTIDIIGVEKILIKDNELYVGDKLVASWTDNVTKNCKVELRFSGIAVNSGEVAKKS